MLFLATAHSCHPLERKWENAAGSYCLSKALELRQQKTWGTFGIVNNHLSVSEEQFLETRSAQRGEEIEA